MSEVTHNALPQDEDTSGVLTKEACAETLKRSEGLPWLTPTDTYRKVNAIEGCTLKQRKQTMPDFMRLLHVPLDLITPLCSGIAQTLTDGWLVIPYPERGCVFYSNERTGQRQAFHRAFGVIHPSVEFDYTQLKLYRALLAG